jgi:ADP-ribose pyrophosphatase
MYATTGLSFGEQDPDDDEFLSVYKIPFDDAVNMVLSGEITDAKTQTAILKLKMLLDNKTINL